ncbi:unnamed protein product, partial [Ectocarpus sp. 6 AP-2014]
LVLFLLLLCTSFPLSVGLVAALTSGVGDEKGTANVLSRTVRLYL